MQIDPISFPLGLAQSLPTPCRPLSSYRPRDSQRNSRPSEQYRPRWLRYVNQAAQFIDFITRHQELLRERKETTYRDPLRPEGHQKPRPEQLKLTLSHALSKPVGPEDLECPPSLFKP